MVAKVDIVILGGGCAGLALARELALRPSALRTVIIEPRLHYEEDRTWSFWENNHSPLRLRSRGQWSSWEISCANQSYRHRSSEWHYHQISSGDYYQDALTTIHDSERTELRLGVEAGDIAINADGAVVTTSAGPVEGKWVIDTRPPAQKVQHEAPLTQLFSGVEVETEVDVFDPTTVTLMGNLRATADGLAFDYVLPLSPRQALIEYTVLSPQPHDPARLDAPCDDLVRDLCGTGASMLRRERGALPMGLASSRPSQGPVVLAGTPAGALRPSSGYAFRRIQTWATRCADLLVDKGHPITEAMDPPLHRLMDRIFLEALTADMSQAPADFSRIARALDGSGFARFMSDQPTTGDWARVIAGLPKIRYLLATMAVLANRSKVTRPSMRGSHPWP